RSLRRGARDTGRPASRRWADQRQRAGRWNLLGGSYLEAESGGVRPDMVTEAAVQRPHLVGGEELVQMSGGAVPLPKRRHVIGKIRDVPLQDRQPQIQCQPLPGRHETLPQLRGEASQVLVDPVDRAVLAEKLRSRLLTHPWDTRQVV